jgi:hypothetical protein
MGPSSVAGSVRAGSTESCTTIIQEHCRHGNSDRSSAEDTGPPSKNPVHPMMAERARLPLKRELLRIEH